MFRIRHPKMNAREGAYALRKAKILMLDPKCLRADRQELANGSYFSTGTVERRLNESNQGRSQVLRWHREEKEESVQLGNPVLHLLTH